MFPQSVLGLLLLCLLPWRADAQAKAPVSAAHQNATVQVVLLSDPHFDPFRDPTKVKRLNAAPVSEWKAILSEPAAADAPERYAAVQIACGEKGVDSEYTLLDSSFTAAAKSAGEHPAFVLLAGDLLVHRFDCGYQQLVDHSPEGLERFAEKTVSYVLLQLHAHFPATPIYAALGNNDSGCGDYQLDPANPFLRNTAEAVQQGWRGVKASDRKIALADYERLGSYSLPFAAPMQHTRIVVLNDTFLSSTYRGCDGKAHPEHGEALLQWLEHTLSEARQHGEHVWVLAHIPPGVNVYSTFLHATKVCDGAAPTMFLVNERLSEILSRYGATVRLFVAGHTHVDEMHVIGEDEQASNLIAIKSVPSITPLSGNGPAFLTGTVDPASATLLDYKLMHADAAQGSQIRWTAGYDYGRTYGQSRFDAEAVNQIIERFGSENAADAAAVQNYQRHYTTGLKRLALQAVWPQYQCSMHHDTAEGYAGCSCKTTKPK